MTPAASDPPVRPPRRFRFGHRPREADPGGPDVDPGGPDVDPRGREVFGHFTRPRPGRELPVQCPTCGSFTISIVIRTAHCAHCESDFDPFDRTIPVTVRPQATPGPDQPPRR